MMGFALYCVCVVDIKHNMSWLSIWLRFACVNGIGRK